MNKNKIFFVISGLGILIYMITKNKSSFEKLIDKNGILFNLINRKKGNLLIVIGGINYANNKFMYDQIPDKIKDECFIVIAPYNINYNFLQLEINDFIAKNKILINKIALIGFSAGGHIVQKNYNKNLFFVGLIDPSVNDSYLNNDINNNMFMLYNHNNWSGYPNIKKNLPLLNNKINNFGGESLEILESHSKIPNLFFKKYTNKLIK